VPVPLVERFRRALPGRKLVNIYGATELTADATYYDFDAMPAGLATAPIGVPLPGVFARIVDPQLREVSDAETGEVVISGVCLARGYLGRDDLTAERFVANPFPEGGRLYRTRDVGRRLASGDIQYLGRLDQLVKIRGFRVELGEVEAVVGAAPGVAHAVAIARDEQLIAFYVGERELLPAELRAFALARVPMHAVPNRFVRLAAFPVNVNGKVDRAALATLPLTIGAAGAPPATDDERRVAAVWREILGHDAIGRDQDFFDLGGTSLAAMRVIARLRDRHGVDLPIATLFDAPTIASLAPRLAAARPAAAHRPLVATDRPIPPVLPLSVYQFPFWMFRALTGGVSVVADVFAFAARVDVARLQDAFARTVAAFDALWMRYPRWRPVQELAARRPYALDVCISDDVAHEAVRNLARPFDLTAPPHVHARLVRMRSGDRLLIAIPHVAVDMASFELFRRTLEAAYAGQAPAPGGASLLDLVEWERTPGDHAADARYWAEIAPGPATNRLPSRMFSRARVRAWSERPVSAAMLARLEAYAREHAISLPLALVGAIYRGLASATDLDAPTALVMVEKRDRAELRELFCNLTAVMPCRVAGARGLAREVAARVARQLVASAEHTDHLMRRPTLWNDFWAHVPWGARRAMSALGRWLARGWDVDPALVAEYLFALVPPFERKGDRVMFVINILPEVTQPTDGHTITRQRSLPEMLLPGDLVTSADSLLDRTLQVHVTNAGGVVVNLYGGGLAQTALDEINDHIAAALAELA
jgi:aryl carrier-like protein